MNLENYINELKQALLQILSSQIKLFYNFRLFMLVVMSQRAPDTNVY